MIEMFVISFLCCIMLQGTDAIIYRLNDTEYARMPPVMHLDPYETCQRDLDAMYCTAEFGLVSDKPSPLLDMIKEYSEYRVANYNHSKLRYGICVTQTCKDFYEINNTGIKLTLEACLNKSLSEKYDLKVNILDENYCRSPGSSLKDTDQLDVLVGKICVIFLLLNCISSLCVIDGEESTVMNLISCFSLKRNWKKLISIDEIPSSQELNSLHGIRVISTNCVIIGHSMLICVVAIQNTQFIEEIYKCKLCLMMNGTLIMQTFLMMSAFLLVYNWLLRYETLQPTLYMLWRHIFHRWLRLVPANAFVLALTTTWFAYSASGPFWNKYVEQEMNDCRQYWWQHIFYLQNYFHTSTCMVQSWYLAVDTQLYIAASIIMFACKTTYSRKVTLASLFAFGIIIPAMHVYFQDLNGQVIPSPEAIFDIFMHDPDFNSLYKRTHANIPGYTIGMSLALLVYQWQKDGVRDKYRTLTYRLLYWSLFPLGILCVCSGSIFYSEGPRPPVYIRMFYAAFFKSAFALVVAGLTLGCIFKFEGIYRSILEWRWWAIPSRLSYSAYLLHIALIKADGAALTYLPHHSYFTMAQLCCAILIKTYMAACLFWLLVEAPISNMRMCHEDAKIEHKDENETKSSEKEKET